MTVNSSTNDDQKLLKKYEPVLRFSRDERFFPTSVGEYLQNCVLQTKDGEKIKHPKIADLQDKTNEHWLDLTPDVSGSYSKIEILGEMWRQKQEKRAIIYAVAVFICFLIFGYFLFASFTWIDQIALSIMVGIIIVFVFALSFRFAVLASLFLLLFVPLWPTFFVTLLFAGLMAVGLFFLTARAGVAVQLKTGMPLSWRNEALRIYEEEIVADTKHVPTCYGRIQKKDQWTILQYHYFYVFNDWRYHGGLNLHEGDWESVTVYLNAERERPYGVAYSQHHGKEFLLYENTAHSDQNGGFHPVVYVGLGSHANYPFADKRRDPSEMERFGALQSVVYKIELQARRFGLFGGAMPADVADGNGPSLWSQFDDDLDEYIQEKKSSKIKMKLKTIDESESVWVAFTGLWGKKTQISDESGPRGPKWTKPEEDIQNQRQSWQYPLDWLEERSASKADQIFFAKLAKVVEETWPVSDDVAEYVDLTDYMPEEHGRSLLIYGDNPDTNRKTLLQLLHRLDQSDKSDNKHYVPIFLPSFFLTGTPGKYPAQEIIDRICEALNVIYGWPLGKFKEWLDRVYVEDELGDQYSLVLFLEFLEVPSQEWLKSLHQFTEHRYLVVAMPEDKSAVIGTSKSMPMPETPELAKPQATIPDLEIHSQQDLVWFAKNLCAQQQSIFFEDQIQPNWLTPIYLRPLMYKVIPALLVLIVVTLMTWFVAQAVVPPMFEPDEPALTAFRTQFGLLFGMATGISACLFAFQMFGWKWSLVVTAVYTFALFVGINSIVEDYNMPTATQFVAPFLFGPLVGFLYYIYGRNRAETEFDGERDLMQLAHLRFSWRKALFGGAIGMVFGVVFWGLSGEVRIQDSLSPLFGTQNIMLDFATLSSWGRYSAFGLLLFIMYWFGLSGESAMDNRISPDHRQSVCTRRVVRAGIIGGLCFGLPYWGPLYWGIINERSFLMNPMNVEIAIFGFWMMLLAGILMAIAAGGIILLQHLLVKAPLSGRLKKVMATQAEGVLSRRGEGHEFTSLVAMQAFCTEPDEP